jgi:AcrR family transcriptional regulator
VTTAHGRKSRSDGERSRRAILATAARLATVEGLDGLTIGRLAEQTGMSKSGLFAHFGSKEELQLAIVAAAEEVFQEEVLAPALAGGEGRARLELLCECFISHVARSVFPGGCFFASTGAELDTRPGRVRDRIAAVHRAWGDLMRATIRQAQERGEIDAAVDPGQLAFELNAMLAQANGLFVLFGDPAAFDMARRAIADRLERAAAPARPGPPAGARA